MLRSAWAEETVAITLAASRRVPAANERVPASPPGPREGQSPPLQEPPIIVLDDLFRSGSRAASTRHQAKDLLRAAKNGDGAALIRLRAVSDVLILSAAQLAVAREYGLASWAKPRIEVVRREILTSRDLDRLTALIAEHPELATEQMQH